MFAEHIRDVNAALNLKQNAIRNVGRGTSEQDSMNPMSAEGVEDLASLALALSGASDETENLAGDSQDVLTV